jgi:hypothetical protein
MRKLVYKNIIIKNDKILINKKYNNFRFHYSDIRDTIEINFTAGTILNGTKPYKIT